MLRTSEQNEAESRTTSSWKHISSWKMVVPTREGKTDEQTTNGVQKVTLTQQKYISLLCRSADLNWMSCSCRKNLATTTAGIGITKVVNRMVQNNINVHPTTENHTSKSPSWMFDLQNRKKPKEPCKNKKRVRHVCYLCNSIVSICPQQVLLFVY